MHKKGSMHISMNSVGLLSIVLIFMGLILAVASSSAPISKSPSGFATFEQPPATTSAPVPKKTITPTNTNQVAQDNNELIIPNKITVIAGKSRTINAQVKNINSDTKTDVSITPTECLGADITINQNSQTILGGETKDYLLQISSGSTASGSYECTLKAISSKYQVLGIKKVTFIVQ